MKLTVKSNDNLGQLYSSFAKARADMELEDLSHLPPYRLPVPTSTPFIFDHTTHHHHIKSLKSALHHIEASAKSLSISQPADHRAATSSGLNSLVSSVPSLLSRYPKAK